MTSLTKTERLVLGGLFKANIPDVIIDYHSLGKAEGCKYDRGDMKVIIPANTTKWGMDEQIYQLLAAYYFGGSEIGNMPWSYLKEKVDLLHTQDFNDDFDIPEESAYTNYTCGPAYLKWHCLVYGMETNHWAISRAGDIASSGLSPCKALLKMGSNRFPWEKYEGYPVNLLHGDFRISLRSVGENASERRASRAESWRERKYLSIPQREMPVSAKRTPSFPRLRGVS